MAPKGYVLTPAEARDFNRMRARNRRQGPPKARRSPRRRRYPSGGTTTTRTDPSSWTVVEIDPSDGAQVALMDRGRRRYSGSATEVRDIGMMYDQDNQVLYVCGNGWINKSNGVLVKWDVDPDSDTAYSALWYSTEGSFTSPGVHLSTAGVISGSVGGATSGTKIGENLAKASDGKIWLAGGTRLAAYDPDTGAQSIDIAVPTNAVFRADSSGGVMIVDTAGTGGKYMRIYNSSGTETASWSVGNAAFVEVSGAVILVANAAGTTLKTLNLADLTEISTRSVPAGETYLSGCTDGTNAYVATDHATTPKYRSYLVSNLATENWNATRDTTAKASVHMKIANSALYDWSTHVRKISASDGSETWEYTGDNTQPGRNGCAVDSSRVYVGINSTNINLHVLNESTGNAVWSEGNWNTNTGFQYVLATADGRVFMCGARTLS